MTLATYSTPDLVTRLDAIVTRSSATADHVTGYAAKYAREDARELRALAVELRKRLVPVPAAPTVTP